jgi:NADH:ubiquinone oxidoreductase subunit 5 (subunit L)/multisubunit Na+/H+ antiporter MnhA subunit
LKIGGITAAYGGIVSLFQSDIKKLLAYSTMSSCGVLVILISIGQIYSVILYMFLHGVLKASIFFCVSSFIKFYKTQDIRYMGCSQVYFRLETFCLFLCLLNFACLPSTFGFFFKDIFLINYFYGFYDFFDIGLILVAIISSFFYSIKIFYYVILDYLKIFVKNSSNILLSTLFKFNTNFLFWFNHFISVIFLLYCGFIFLLFYFFFFEVEYIDFFGFYYNELIYFIKLAEFNHFYVNYFLFIYFIFIIFI